MSETTDQLKSLFEDAISSFTPVSGRIEPFSGHRSKDVIKFLEDFEFLCLANKWSTDSQKLSRFPLYLTDSARDWYIIYFVQGSKKIDKWNDAKQLLISGFTSSDYKYNLREQIDKRIQLPNETVSSYAFAKKSLIMRYDPKMDETEVVRKIIKGVNPSIALFLYAANLKNWDEMIAKMKEVETGASAIYNRQK